MSEFSNETEAQTEVAIADSVQRRVSCGRCHNCDHWDTSTEYTCDFQKIEAPQVGFCPLFQKMTRRDHGAQCTAWQAANESSSPTAGGGSGGAQNKGTK
jgi:hypothetical protein